MDDTVTDLPPEGAAPGPLPIPYTAEEVSRTFSDLLATFDFKAELHELKFSPLRPFKRAQAKRLFTVISIVLWHIALEKSFPNDADAFFSHFIATFPPLVGEGRAARKLRELVAQYDALVTQKKDTDFTAVADTLAEALGIRHNDRRSQRLRLSLRIRAIYEVIFNKLI